MEVCETVFAIAHRSFPTTALSLPCAPHTSEPQAASEQACSFVGFWQPLLLCSFVDSRPSQQAKQQHTSQENTPTSTQTRVCRPGSERPQVRKRKQVDSSNKRTVPHQRSNVLCAIRVTRKQVLKSQDAANGEAPQSRLASRLRPLPAAPPPVQQRFELRFTQHATAAPALPASATTTAASRCQQWVPT